MFLSHNPSPEIINELKLKSSQKSAKWLKDMDTGELWYWPSGELSHHEMAVTLHIKNYEKGIDV